jgi:uncharacterized protein YecE (DUF72 family)
LNNIRLGTSGWSGKDWGGDFYPKGLPANEQLAYYATQFRVVEVDGTFEVFPTAETVQGWRDQTPDGFGFSLKVPRVLIACEREREDFLKAARVLGNKLLCCLLQFGFVQRGYALNSVVFLKRLDPFLAAWPDDVPIAVEFKNRAWFVEPVYECLRSHNAVLAFGGHPWISPWSSNKSVDTTTGPFTYLRLPGDQTQAVAQAICRLSEKVPVLAFGHAPGAVRQLGRNSHGSSEKRR